MLYAVKKIKKKIGSVSEGNIVVKETCAHAALTGCPNLVRYFGCWLDDGHLHIQTELCDLGTLDRFVVSSTGTIMGSVGKFTEGGAGIATGVCVGCVDGGSNTILTSAEAVTCGGLVSQRGPISDAFAWLVLKSVADALRFMHKRGTGIGGNFIGFVVVTLYMQ